MVKIKISQDNAPNSIEIEGVNWKLFKNSVIYFGLFAVLQSFSSSIKLFFDKIDES